MPWCILRGLTERNHVLLNFRWGFGPIHDKYTLQIDLGIFSIRTFSTDFSWKGICFEDTCLQLQDGAPCLPKNAVEYLMIFCQSCFQLQDGVLGRHCCHPGRVLRVPEVEWEQEVRLFTPTWPSEPKLWTYLACILVMHKLLAHSNRQEKIKWLQPAQYFKQNQNQLWPKSHFDWTRPSQPDFRRRQKTRVRSENGRGWYIYPYDSLSEPKWLTSPHLQPRGEVSPLRRWLVTCINRTHPMLLWPGEPV